VNLRRRFVLYLAAVFLILAVTLLALFFQRGRPGVSSGGLLALVVVEAALAILFVAGLRLVGTVFRPAELLDETVRLLKEEEFNTRVRQQGVPETDRLVAVYNEMADNLRRQRIYNREREYVLEKILRVSPSGIITFDFDGRVADLNPSAQRLLGVGDAALAGRDLASLGTSLATDLAALQVGESRLLAVQGRRRLKASRGHYLDRGFYKSFIIVDELTEELRRAEKEAYEKLVRIMSHEINNSIAAANSLLHSCLNYSDQIHERDRADFQMALSVVIARTEHLKAFMSDYAQVVKLPLPQRRPVTLQELMAHIRILLQAELERRGIDCTWRIAQDLAPVAMDRQQMEQALLNIFKNALEAQGECGRVRTWMEVSETTNRPVLVVEDDGAGIPPEVADALFTPFFTTKKDGQGIGLTMVREILNNHGFDYALESSPGTPTRFTIWF